MGALTYLKNLISDPNIASVTPTSSFGVQKMCSAIDFPNTKLIVEYGSATGVFTRYLLERLPASAKVIALDTNLNFVNELSRSLIDPRLSIFHESAEHVREKVAQSGISHADYIISGIPFSFLEHDLADRIVNHTHAALRPAGKFLVYQFLKPIGKNTKGIHQHLPNHFTDIKRDTELRNIPPLVLYEATKSP